MRITFLLSILLYTSVLSAQVLQPSQGGTGTSVPPAAGQVLVGQSGGTYSPSTVTIGNVSGTGTVGYIPLWSGSGSSLSNSPIDFGQTTAGVATFANTYTYKFNGAMSVGSITGSGSGIFGNVLGINDSNPTATPSVCASGGSFEMFGTGYNGSSSVQAGSSFTEVCIPGTFGARQVALTSTSGFATSLSVPNFYDTGIAAGSGYNCVQVDTTGKLTNTGAGCAAGSGNVALAPSTTQTIFPPSTVAPAGISLNSSKVNNVFYADAWAGQTAAWRGTWSAGIYNLHDVVTDGSGNYFISVQPANIANPSTAATTCSDTQTTSVTCNWFEASAALTTGYGSGNLPTYVNLAIADITGWLQTANQSSVLIFGPLSGGSSYPLCDGISIPQNGAQSLSLIGYGTGGINAPTYLTMQSGCTLNHAMIYKAPAPLSVLLPSITVNGFKGFGGHLASSFIDIEGCQGCDISYNEAEGGFTDSNNEPAPMNFSINGCCGDSWIYESHFNYNKVTPSVGTQTATATVTGGATQINNTTISGSGGTATLGTGSTANIANGNVVFIGGLTAGSCLNNAGTVDGNGYTVSSVVSNTSFQVTAPVACSAVGSTADSGAGTVYTLSGGTGYTTSPVAILMSTNSFSTPFTTMPTGVSAVVSAGVPQYITQTAAGFGFCVSAGNCVGSGTFAVSLQNNSIFNTGMYFGVTDSEGIGDVVQGTFTPSLTQFGTAGRNGCSIEFVNWPFDAIHFHAYPGGWAQFCDHNGVTYDTPQVDTPLYIAFAVLNGTAAVHGTTIKSPQFSNMAGATTGIGFLVSQNADLSITGDMHCGTTNSTWVKDAYNAPGYGQINLGRPTGGFALNDSSNGSCGTGGVGSGGNYSLVPPAGAARPTTVYAAGGVEGSALVNSGTPTFWYYNFAAGDSNHWWDLINGTNYELGLSTLGVFSPSIVDKFAFSEVYTSSSSSEAAPKAQLSQIANLQNTAGNGAFYTASALDGAGSNNAWYWGPVSATSFGGCWVVGARTGVNAYSEQMKVCPTAGVDGGIITTGIINGVTLASGGKIVYVGSGTYTTATSDTFTVNGATSSSHCSLTPTNATAAAATVAANVSSKSTNSITVSHVATTASGGTVDIICTAN